MSSMSIYKFSDNYYTCYHNSIENIKNNDIIKNIIIKNCNSELECILDSRCCGGKNYNLPEYPIIKNFIDINDKIFDDFIIEVKKWCNNEECTKEKCNCGERKEFYDLYWDDYNEGTGDNNGTLFTYTISKIIIGDSPQEKNITFTSRNCVKILSELDDKDFI